VVLPTGGISAPVLTISTMNYKGIQSATYDASAGDCWVSLVGTGTDTLWISIDGTNAVPFLGLSRLAKH